MEGQTDRSRAGSPAPATNPFQAPDFGEDETFPLDDVMEQPAPSGRPARRRAA
ncbi:MULTISPECIES: hypothetical protein [unclassified Streptomyces]|uniref:hypothetical protein n=1 Tax=unclassified Streptomyces TaxID=2593676 RepID=UPI00211CE918|nr:MULTISPECIES: hypothetical protein [unclassified Streptomyces]